MKLKKLSVISNLVLLFNGLIAPASGASPSKNDDDQALFRLAGQVFFVSDLKKTQSALKILDCVEKDTLLERYFEKPLEEVSSLKFSDLVKLTNDDVKKGLMPFVEYEKLKGSVLARSKDSLSLNELKGLGKKCGKLSWGKINIDQKAVLLSEVYLKDRFSSPESTVVGLQELKKGLLIKDKHEFLKFHLSPFLIKAIKEAAEETDSQERPQEKESSIKATP